MLRYLAQPALLLGFLVATTLGFFGHNFAQLLTARALGDQTPARAGFARVGSRHLDVLGVVAAILTVPAWGFPAAVPVDTRLRRRGRAAVVLLAGPVFLLVMTVGFVAMYEQTFPVRAQGPSSFGLLEVGAAPFVAGFSSAAALCSAGLFVLSCLPVPPLAGGRALWLFTPNTAGWSTWRYRLEEENLGRLIAFGLLMLPLLLGALPDVVGELALPLGRQLASLFV